MHHMDANKMQTDKKLNGNYTKMLQAVWNKSQKLYDYLPPISQTIQVRHAGMNSYTQMHVLADQ